MHRIAHNGVDYFNYVIIPGIIYSKVFGTDYYRNKVRFRFFDKLYQQVVGENGTPDIIYSQYYFNTISGVQLKQKYNIPLVGIEHFSAFNVPVLSDELASWGSFAFSGVDKLICVSRSLANKIERHFGVKSSVVPNMIGNEFLCEVPPVRNHGIFVFVANGSLIKRKGFDVLLEAFAQSELSGQNCMLKIIGGGPEQTALENQAQRLGIARHVHFLGKKNKHEIVRVLSEANVFVLSSRVETFGVVCIESLAMGLPNIATICGGPEEIITPDNGMLVPPEDVNALASAMKEMYRNYTVYNRAAIAEDCRKHFSPMAIAEQLTAVFEDTINTAANFKK